MIFIEEELYRLYLILNIRYLCFLTIALIDCFIMIVLSVKAISIFIATGRSCEADFLKIAYHGEELASAWGKSKLLSLIFYGNCLFSL